MFRTACTATTTRTIEMSRKNIKMRLRVWSFMMGGASGFEGLYYLAIGWEAILSGSVSGGSVNCAFDIAVVVKGEFLGESPVGFERIGNLGGNLPD